jgi:hypothetical protein
MSDILDKIAAAVGCQLCGSELGTSPSDDFCTETCAQIWHARQARPLQRRAHDILIDVDTAGIEAALRAIGEAFKHLAVALGPLLMNATRRTGPLPLAIDGHAYRRRTRRRKP